MKFARYLQDTQTPEWKRAYIDYRRLKKCIAAIRKEQEESHPDASDAGRAASQSRASSLHSHVSVSNRRGDSTSVSLPRKSAIDITLPPPLPLPNAERPNLDNNGRPQVLPSRTSTESRMQRFLRRPTIRTTNTRPALPLRELIPLLTPAETDFFNLMDVELDKVECFYLDREKEFLARTRTLEEQLRELAEHRRLFYAAHPASSGVGGTWLNFKKAVIDLRQRFPKTRAELLRNKGAALRMVEDDLHSDRPLRRQSVSDVGDTRTVTGDGGSGSEGSPGSDDRGERRNRRGKGLSRPPDESRNPDALTATTSGVERHPESGAAQANSRRADVFTEMARVLDPDDYVHAKKKLKAAVLEHYRGLEVLNNYRILNITGFRKALKKFEKVTKITSMDAYMNEKIEPSAFASGKVVSEMIKEMEELFATRFEHGDKKKAMAKLRITSEQSGRHGSIFCSGLYLGLAAPALASGLYQSFQEETRNAISGWAVLLFVYGVFAVPVLFSVLVGLNLLAWSRTRINYSFIFDLEVRTRLDSREYFETPAFILALLVYAFWLSFFRIGSPTIDPTIWPLIWLAFAVFFMINPLPIFRKSSRWWFLRSIGRLLISGTIRVEFTDFWMGDQFCSLVFTLSNFYFVTCVYIGDFVERSQKCSGPQAYWPIIFLLSALPFLVRLVQSLRRYADSRLITHLINGGKYGSGIITYLFYILWRHQGGHSSYLVLWCLSGTFYAIYATLWDLLMDWSLLKPHGMHPFLRSELVYTNYIPVYYFAIISNILLRFSWVIFLPTRGPSTLLRSFIIGVLEMLRRWQWNFYRLENEHLGNMDQYRVTREVPLPYSLDDPAHEEDASDEDRRRKGWMRRRTRTVSPATHPATEVIRLQ